MKVSEVEKLLTVSPKPEEEKKEKVVKPKKQQPAVPATPAYTGPSPTPEQMKQQAEMMRKHPDAVRRSNAALAHFTDQQIREYADQIELVSPLPPATKPQTSLLLTIYTLYAHLIYAYTYIHTIPYNYTIYRQLLTRT